MGKWFKHDGPFTVTCFWNADVPFDELMAELYEYSDDIHRLNAIARYANQFKKHYPLVQMEYLKEEHDKILHRHNGGCDHPGLFTNKTDINL